MGFFEALPDQCPPADAVENEIGQAYRIVFGDPATVEHFKSHAALGKKPPSDMDECRFASCSLFTSLDRVKSVAQLPKLRAQGPILAEVTIAHGSGRWIAHGDHIDFWMYDTFDPIAAIVSMTDAT